MGCSYGNEWIWGKFEELRNKAEVTDNGIGFSQDIDFKNTESLGLKLVNVLTGQINGEIDMNVNNGN